MPKTVNMAKWWKEAKEDLAKSEVKQVGSYLPDGQYEGVVDDVLIKPDKHSGVGVLLTLRVTAGKYEGKKRTKWYGLEATKTQTRADRWGYLRGDLAVMDVDLPNDVGTLKELGEVFDEVKDVAVLFTAKRIDEFDNTYINERLSVDHPKEDTKEEAEEPEDAGSDDEEPLTAKEVREMDEEELKALIEAEELDIDPDEYETWEEVAEKIIEELELED